MPKVSRKTGTKTPASSFIAGTSSSTITSTRKLIAAIALVVPLLIIYLLKWQNGEWIRWAESDSAESAHTARLKSSVSLLSRTLNERQGVNQEEGQTDTGLSIEKLWSLEAGNNGGATLRSGEGWSLIENLNTEQQAQHDASGDSKKTVAGAKVASRDAENTGTLAFSMFSEAIKPPSGIPVEVANRDRRAREQHAPQGRLAGMGTGARGPHGMHGAQGLGESRPVSGVSLWSDMSGLPNIVTSKQLKAVAPTPTPTPTPAPTSTSTLKPSQPQAPISDSGSFSDVANAVTKVDGDSTVLSEEAKQAFQGEQLPDASHAYRPAQDASSFVSETNLSSSPLATAPSSDRILSPNGTEISDHSDKGNRESKPSENSEFRTVGSIRDNLNLQAVVSYLPPKESNLSSPSFRSSCYYTPRNEVVCVASPVCFHPETSYTPIFVLNGSVEDIDFYDRLVCVNIGKGDELSVRSKSVRCQDHLSKYLEDAGFPGTKVIVHDRAWFEAAIADNSATVYVDHDLSLVMQLAESSRNIAHYAGRMLFAEHVMNNPYLYGLDSKPPGLSNLTLMQQDTKATRGPELDSAVLLPNRNTVNFFASALLWHTGLNKLLFSKLPASRTHSHEPASDFSRPLRSFEELKGKEFHWNPSDSRLTQPICFKRAILPAYLKGRFFVTMSEDTLVPQSTAPRSIPPEAVQFRRKAYSHVLEELKKPGMLLDQTVPEDFATNPAKAKRILFLQRSSKGRILLRESERKLVWKLSRIAEGLGFDFDILRTEESTEFASEVLQFWNSSIVIGIHGAALVNAIFVNSSQESAGVLIEIFPYKFHHRMYENGGNAGLYYYSYQLESGDDYPELQSKYNGDADKCMQDNNECKVWYRGDLVKLRVTSKDIEQLGELLAKAIRHVSSS